MSEKKHKFENYKHCVEANQIENKPTSKNYYQKKPIQIGLKLLIIHAGC